MEDNMLRHSVGGSDEFKNAISQVTTYVDDFNTAILDLNTAITIDIRQDTTVIRAIVDGIDKKLPCISNYIKANVSKSTGGCSQLAIPWGI
jgi:hypothetical protein